MAKTVDDQTRFIELRAKGNSFDRIAQEIDTSKPTLLKWQKEFSEQISELKFFHFESLAEQYSLMRIQRLEYLAELYQRIRQELESRDLGNASTEKLIEILTKLESKLISELGYARHIVTEIVETNFDEMLDFDKTALTTEYKVD